MTIENILKILSDIKTAIFIGATTIASGASYLFSVIPDDIGKAATCMGIVLTFFAIRLNVAKRRGVELDNKLKEIRLQKILNGDDTVEIE